MERVIRHKCRTGSPRISVIVPIYNAELFLMQCIESILNQQAVDLELILVNDGSTDTSYELCKRYYEEYENVVIVNKENEGLIKARLSGVKNARGKYIAFVDADDWIAPNMYQDLFRKGENAELIISGISRYYSDGKTAQSNMSFREGRYSKEEIWNHIVPDMLWSEKSDSWELDPSLCTKIFKRELILEQLMCVSELNIYYGEDTAVIFPLMLKINSLAVVRESYYFHRQRKEGVIPAYIQDNQFIEKTYQLYNFLKGDFEQYENNENLMTQVECFFINSMTKKKQCFFEESCSNAIAFPYWKIEKGSRVILYGAGNAGTQLVDQNRKYGFCEIVLWVDADYENRKKEGLDVSSPTELGNITYDYILVSVQKRPLMLEIVDRLLKMGIDKEKIITISRRMYG